METINPRNQITRRGFLELSSAALATAGLLGDANHVAAGIQAIPNASKANDLARRANDYLADHIVKYPKRLKGFAAFALAGS